MRPAYCYTLHGMKDFRALQGNGGASLALEMTVVCRLLLGAVDPPLAHPPPPPPSTGGASQLFQPKKLQFAASALVKGTVQRKLRWVKSGINR